MSEPVWTLHRPPLGAVPPWLDDLRRFRGELLHAGGLRSGFDSAEGPYDPDPADPHSHHVVATVDGTPVAALRVLPWPDAGHGVCARVLGAARLQRVVGALDAGVDDLWEGSGWAVRPGRRRAVLAAETLAGGAAAARSLGRETLVGASGTRYGQLHRVLAAGFRRVEGVAPIPVPALADDLQLVHGTLSDLRPEFRNLVDDVAARLLRCRAAAEDHAVVLADARCESPVGTPAGRRRPAGRNAGGAGS